MCRRRLPQWLPTPTTHFKQQEQLNERLIDWKEQLGTLRYAKSWAVWIMNKLTVLESIIFSFPVNDSYEDEFFSPFNFRNWSKKLTKVNCQRLTIKSLMNQVEASRNTVKAREQHSLQQLLHVQWDHGGPQHGLASSILMMEAGIWPLFTNACFLAESHIYPVSFPLSLPFLYWFVFCYPGSFQWLCVEACIWWF